MPRTIQYRRRLLAIVSAFQDPSEVSQADAHQLVKRLYHDRRVQTIGDLVWGGYVSALTDSVFYENAEYLEHTRQTLLRGSPELYRTYLNYDFRPDFSEVEREWYARLVEVVAWLRANPFPDFPDRMAGEQEYERRIEAGRVLQARTPPPVDLASEMLYHLVLRTASSVVTGVSPSDSHRQGYLAAAAPLTIYHWDPAEPDERCHFMPDARESVAWAERALGAIALQGWLCVTCQITPNAYLVSLH